MIDQCYIEEKITNRNGDSSIRHYSKLKLLGKGGFAKVHEFICVESGQITACKIIEKSSISKGRARQKLMSEIKIHRSLKHKNIVRFENSFEDQTNVYILLELCSNESLSVLLRRRKRLSELEVQCYLVQVLEALRYMHSCRVIHRDIKLGNIFLSNQMEVKMGDFGLSCRLEFDDERKRTICGTPNYIAPEIIDGKNGHSYEVDIWSFGVLMYTMLIGRPPFDSSDVKATYNRIKMNSYIFPQYVEISREAKDLISKVLVTDPACRPTIDAILNHEFFNKNKIPSILPYSTLTVPLSPSYIKAFDKKPTTPRGISLLKSKEDEVFPMPRSSSQQNIEERKTLGTASPELNDIAMTKDLSDSGQTATGTGSGSGHSIIKKALTSLYSPSKEGPKVWLKHFVDYQHKYGLGYLLSNGCSGCYFNDNTKMISNSSFTSFKYIPKKSADQEIIAYHLDSYPKDLYKKVQLLCYFRKHLIKLGKFEENEEDNIYVKTWQSTRHAILLRMTNKTIQVYFRDQTELVLYGGTKVVAYVDKEKQTIESTIEEAMGTECKELAKRLKYTREVLLNSKTAQMLNL